MTPQLRRSVTAVLVLLMSTVVPLLVGTRCVTITVHTVSVDVKNMVFFEKNVTAAVMMTKTITILIAYHLFMITVAAVVIERVFFRIR
jgi:hypothetical protein